MLEFLITCLLVHSGIHSKQGIFLINFNILNCSLLFNLSAISYTSLCFLYHFRMPLLHSASNRIPSDISNSKISSKHLGKNLHLSSFPCHKILDKNDFKSFILNSNYFSTTPATCSTPVLLPLKKLEQKLRKVIRNNYLVIAEWAECVNCISIIHLISCPCWIIKSF